MKHSVAYPAKILAAAGLLFIAAVAMGLQPDTVLAKGESAPSATAPDVAPMRVAEGVPAPSATTTGTLPTALAVTLAKPDAPYAAGLRKGQISAALTVLNAAHTAPQDFAKAAPDSQFGRIAAYREAMVVAEELTLYVANAGAALADAPAPGVGVAEMLAAQEQATTRGLALDADIARLTQALADAGGSDAAIEAALIDAMDAKADTLTKIAAFDADIAAIAAQQATHDAARALYDAATAELDLQRTHARTQLEAAANGTVSGAMLAQLHELLGLAPPTTAN